MSRYRVAITCMIFLLCAVAVWALTQGPNNCGTGTDVQLGNLVPWANPGNIATSGQSSTVSMGASTGSDDLRATNYAFAIPTGSTINGIQVSITRKASLAAVVFDNGIFLLRSGNHVGSDHSNGSAWPNAFAAQSYGSVADLWGTTWSAADINSSSFGVAIQALNTDSIVHTASVQAFVTITITYTGPSGGLSFSPGIIGTQTQSRKVYGL